MSSLDVVNEEENVNDDTIDMDIDEEDHEYLSNHDRRALSERTRTEVMHKSSVYYSLTSLCPVRWWVSTGMI
jgi:hypothetical protein